ncbi:hypothetical protein KEC56_01915 [Microbacterium sp. YMB-B2]|uniref:MFS transporter n=1 Tax=Microbacterium tenebrionis TaxID=2830665 RepID=A0A9X1LM53_9MICO|nr:hypothetical protein [Microbacterium tenebrionis]MCC2028294.1 hypothetical protein [Microbacterium tenebrionis]
MRPAVTAVGPVIDRISADTGVPLALLGSLSTIVLITWAIVSPFAHGFGRRLGLGGACLAGLMVWPDGIGLWVVPLGVSSGLSLGVSLTLIADRARDHTASSALSGMSQSVGYTIEAIGPALFGAVHAATGSWTLPLTILLVSMSAQTAFGIFAGRDRFVLESRS